MTVGAELALEGPHAGRVLVVSRFRDKELVKQIPGVIWDKDFPPDGIWHAPLSYATAHALRGVFGDALQVGPNLRAWVRSDFERRVSPCVNLRFLDDAPGWGVEGLRPDQRVGVAMLWTGRAVLLGDDMGGGKTVMGSVALAMALRTPIDLVRGDVGFDVGAVPPGAAVVRDLGPALVVCPNGVKRGWERELAKWAPDLRVAVLRGGAAERRRTIDKLRECPVHATRTRTATSATGDAVHATSGTYESQTPTSSNVNTQTQNGGTTTRSTASASATSADEHTSLESSASASTNTSVASPNNAASAPSAPNPNPAADAAATSASSPSTTTTPRERSGDSSARRATRRSRKLTATASSGSTASGCTCDDRIDVLICNWEVLRVHARLAPYGSVRLRTCSACDPNSDVKPTSCERCNRELNEIRFSVVIADEAHRAKDPKSKQTRALWSIAHRSRPVFAWGLTGTTIADSMEDWWAIGHFLAPYEYPAKTKYVERYGLQSWNAYGGLEIVGIRPDTRDEFFAFFDPRFLRRPREYQLRNLREPQFVDRVVEMAPKQAKLYAELADEMIGRLDDGDVVLATNPLTQTARLNQAAASYLRKDDCARCGTTGLKPGTDPEAGEKCANCSGRGFTYTPVLPSSKITDLLDFLGELPPTENVVVFAVSRKLLELTQTVLDDKGIANVIISGAVPEAQRYQAIDAFARGEKRVCLVVIDAGGEGIDGLQHGSRTVYFMQRHYAAWKNKQAIGRVLRSGQEGQVVVVNARAEGTIEDDKEVIIAEKEERFEELVRDREFLRRMLQRRPGDAV